jgi:DNA-binding CsgD family transcriptional regulator
MTTNPFFNTIDLEHLAIAKYKNGMMLYDTSTKNADLLLPLIELFALPYSVYLLDMKGATVKINQVGSNICGFKSPSQAIGKTIFDVSMEDKGQDLLDNCDSVLQQESVKIFDEFTLRFDGRSLHFLSIKFPCYDSEYQLKGTLGISIVLGEHPLAEAITQLTDLGLLPRNTPPDQNIKLNLGDISLTPREKECLEYTVKGFTAKQIAKKLLISPRTVEEYLNQLKLKLNVGTKQEMIQKVLDS